jgi:hypothetical protein
VDLTTYRKLKKSDYKEPNVTTVIQDPEMILAMYLESFNLAQNELDILWDQQMVTFIINNFREVFFHVEKLSKLKDIQFRIVVELNEGNRWFLKSTSYCKIRQIDTVPENIQLIDARIYLKPIFELEGEQISQILWSNDASLVNQKQNQFEKLWRIAGHSGLE